MKAEAAVWLARLHADDRAPEDEAGFRAWLLEDGRHAAAFELVTVAWGAAGGVRQPERRRRSAPSFTLRAVVTSCAVGVILLAAIGGWRLATAETYATGVGEQRRVTLSDGSSVLLDTNSRIRVALTKERRRIDLIKGRAHFDVARAPSRPFMVFANQQKIVATGTAFDVMRSGDEVAVVLVEGRVAVQPVQATSSGSTRLAPGERLRVRRAQAPVRDAPDLATVTAWQAGRAVFDDVTLGAAVAEMNRYSRRTIMIADPTLASVRISGVYSTHDAEAFARSVTALLPATVQISSGRILLSSGPQEKIQERQ